MSNLSFCSLSTCSLRITSRSFSVSLPHQKLVKNRFSLGEDWANYAKAVVYKTNDGNKLYPQGDIVFNSALEVWLELRKEINFNGNKKNATKNSTKEEENMEESKDNATAEETKTNDEDKQKSQSESIPSEMDFEDFKVVESFDQRLREKLKALEIGNLCLWRAAGMTFF